MAKLGCHLASFSCGAIRTFKADRHFPGQDLSHSFLFVFLNPRLIYIYIVNRLSIMGFMVRLAHWII